MWEWYKNLVWHETELVWDLNIKGKMAQYWNSRGSKHWERNDTFLLLGCLENMAGQCLLSISKCLDKITLKASTFLVVLIYTAIALNEVGKSTGNV